MDSNRSPSNKFANVDETSDTGSDTDSCIDRKRSLDLKHVPMNRKSRRKSSVYQVHEGTTILLTAIIQI